MSKLFTTLTTLYYPKTVINQRLSSKVVGILGTVRLPHRNDTAASTTFT